MDSRNGSNSSGLVKIHKRERSSPPGSSQSSSLQTAKKRYKLVDNISTIKVEPPVEVKKEVPESRAAFLREVTTRDSRDYIDSIMVFLSHSHLRYAVLWVRISFVPLDKPCWSTRTAVRISSRL